MASGFFIVVDGIDGSGKGTAIKGIKEFLESKGIGRNKLFVTREPSDSAYGKKAREILRQENEPKNRAEELMELYIKDRKEHIEKEIMPALKNEKIVICDRYKYSTIAYQAAQGIDVKSLLEKNKGFLKPDLSIILDLPAEDALKRIENDSSRNKKDVFERREFLGKVRSFFLKMPSFFPDENIKIVGASASKAEVIEKANAEVENALL